MVSLLAEYHWRLRFVAPLTPAAAVRRPVYLEQRLIADPDACSSIAVTLVRRWQAHVFIRDISGRCPGHGRQSGGLD